MTQTRLTAGMFRFSRKKGRIVVKSHRHSYGVRFDFPLNSGQSLHLSYCPSALRLWGFSPEMAVWIGNDEIREFCLNNRREFNKFVRDVICGRLGQINQILGLTDNELPAFTQNTAEYRKVKRRQRLLQKAGRKEPTNKRFQSLSTRIEEILVKHNCRQIFP